MNVPTTIEAQIESCVASGRYPSSDAVLEEAFRALEMVDRERDRLRAELAEAMEQCRRGEATPGDPFFKELLRHNATLPRKLGAS